MTDAARSGGMEASHLTLRGDRAGEFADAFVERKARESERSLNKWRPRNLHRLDGEGFTHLAYERGSSWEHSWLVVSVFAEQLDRRTCSVTALVGGGGRGPFKLEDVTMRRLLQGEASVGQAGRFGTVLEDVRRVCESLDLTVETEWESETPSSVSEAVEQKIFYS